MSAILRIIKNHDFPMHGYKIACSLVEATVHDLPNVRAPLIDYS